LSWETTNKELREHFRTYGKIESVNVKTDPMMGRSRGFAFIVFKQGDSIDKVLNARDHNINNKRVNPQKAKAPKAGPNLSQRIANLKASLKLAYKSAGIANKRLHQTNKKYYNQRAKQHSFEMGEFVYVYNPARKPGLS
jgi:RNA recognition motif-containing protein